VALRESAVLYARRGFANIGVTPSKHPTRCDPNFLSENAEDAEQVILCACDFVTNSRGDIYDALKLAMFPMAPLPTPLKEPMLNELTGSKLMVMLKMSWLKIMFLAQARTARTKVTG
jgi:hypothetical protein